MRKRTKKLDQKKCEIFVFKGERSDSEVEIVKVDRENADSDGSYDPKEYATWNDWKFKPEDARLTKEEHRIFKRLVKK